MRSKLKSVNFHQAIKGLIKCPLCHTFATKATTPKYKAAGNGVDDAMLAWPSPTGGGVGVGVGAGAGADAAGVGDAVDRVTEYVKVQDDIVKVAVLLVNVKVEGIPPHVFVATLLVASTLSVQAPQLDVDPAGGFDVIVTDVELG